jgi:hypothetical protein
MDQTTWRSFQETVDGILRCLTRLQKKVQRRRLQWRPQTSPRKRKKKADPRQKKSSIVTESVPDATAGRRWKTQLWSYYHFRNKSHETLKSAH